MPDFRPQPETLAALEAYDWPGNVRELKHCIDRMAALSSPGGMEDALPSQLMQSRFAVSLERLSDAVDNEGLREEIHPRAFPVISIPESEKAAIVRALAATGGERSRAAAILRIGRTTLYRKMKQYGLD